MAGGLASAGAAAGTAVMPGIGTAVGGVLGALGDAFMGGGGTSAPSGPLTASTAVYGSGLDASGWAVNFKGVQSANSMADKAGAAGESLAAAASSVPAAAWLAFGLIAVVLVWKKSSKSAK